MRFFARNTLLRIIIAVAVLNSVGMIALSLAQKKQIAMNNLKDKKVAVAVYNQNISADDYVKTAQSRLEQILRDNEISVLDKGKTGELTDVCKKLNDPGVFVTAETFVTQSKKFKIHGLVGLYLVVETKKGVADYFSSTAHADVRYIDDVNADVASLATPSMGLIGNPPSDGLTGSSAAINAVKRAVDSACESMGLIVMDKTRGRSVRIALDGPHDLDSIPKSRGSDNDKDLWKYADLDDETWRTEKATCTARSPSGNLSAVCGYIVDTDFHRRPARLYGSRVHVVDLKNNDKLYKFQCSPVEKKNRSAPNTKKVLDCTFLSNWRYLAAITGNYLFLWDTQTGEQLAKEKLQGEQKSITFYRNSRGQGILAVTDGRTAQGYFLVID